MGSSNQEEKTRYVRLAESTLLPVPDCYLEDGFDSGSETCWLCAVKKQCVSRQEVELR